MFRMTDSDLRVDESDAGWVLSGPAASRFALVNEFLGYLADRRYSPKTVRAYAFDLLAFCRWLADEDVPLADVTAETLLRYLSHCRTATFRGRLGRERVLHRDGRAPATPRRPSTGGWPRSRHVRVPATRDPGTPSPVPRVRRAAGRPRRARRPAGTPGGTAAGIETAGQAARRLPKDLDAGEATALLDSFRSWRDKAIAGLMPLSGLRSAEVLALDVGDVDIPRGWALPTGKGGKDAVPRRRRRRGSSRPTCFSRRPDRIRGRHGHQPGGSSNVAKGPKPGRPLTPRGWPGPCSGITGNCRGVKDGHPHSLRHSFGTALARHRPGGDPGPDGT